jgi:predicted CopG family antitoxin
MFKYKHKWFGITLLSMVKTLTIRDEVYKKLISIKDKNESFSELFERLVEDRSPSEILKRLRGRIKLTASEKRGILEEINSCREERRQL